ncbi:MAG: DUF11 domain-containing protein, partial [bacterium]|nr:DUF11 domain-containing protein [bacterium]
MRSASFHLRLVAFLVAFLCLGTATTHAQTWLATGEYNGNSNDGRAITGVGFQPDVVFITPEGNTPTYCRTATMPAGQSRSIGTNEGLVPGRLVSLDADGFTVDGVIEVNGSSEFYSWVAMKVATGTFEQGVYTGNGGPSQAIGGLPGEPLAVIVLSEAAEQTLLRTATMSDLVSYPLRGEIPVNDGITSFTADGFDVGTGTVVNGSGTDYYYLAWFDQPGAVAQGSHLGDGSNPRTLSGLGLDPAWLLIRGSGNQDGVHRSDAIVGDATQFFQDRDTTNDRILGLIADGFEVANRPETNSNGVTYNWLAFADADVGATSDLELVAVADDMSPNPGEAVTFTLTLTNQGTDTANTIMTTGLLPAGLTFVSDTPGQGTFDNGTGIWDAGSLDAGASTTLDITATVDVDQAGRLIEFTTMVTSAIPSDGTPDNNTAAIELAIPAVDIAVAVAVTDTVAVTGDSVVLGVSATNLGPDAASGLVLDVLRDPRLEIQFVSPSLGSFDVPSGVWTIGDLPSATTASLVLAVRIGAGSAGDTLVTTAQVSGLDQADANSANDTDNARVRVLATVETADLGVIVVAGDPTPEVGSSLDHTITLLNTGPDDATGVAVAVDFPAELSLTVSVPSVGSYDGAGTWTVGPLPAAGTATLVLTADVLPAGAGAVLTTSATAAGDQLDPDASDDTAGAVIDVPMPSGSDHIEILAVAGGAMTVRPGDGDRPVLKFSVVNHGA